MITGYDIHLNDGAVGIRQQEHNDFYVITFRIRDEAGGETDVNLYLREPFPFDTDELAKLLTRSKRAEDGANPPAEQYIPVDGELYARFAEAARFRGFEPRQVLDNCMRNYADRALFTGSLFEEVEK